MKLIEAKNIDYVKILDQDFLTVEGIRDAYTEVIDGTIPLKEYARICHAAFLKVLRDSDVMIKYDEREPEPIDITKGGGQVNSTKAKSLFDFTINARYMADDIVAGKTLRYSGSGSGHGTKPKARPKNLIGIPVKLLNRDGTPAVNVLKDLTTIYNFYKAAYENVVEPEKIADKLAKAGEEFEKTLEQANKEEDAGKRNLDLDDYFYTLGWLAKNVTRIHALIPERGTFLNTFLRYNPEADPENGYTIHKDGRTSGGYPNQFTYMFLVHFKRNALDNPPSEVKSYLANFGSTVKNPMSCNKLALALVNRYGFKFGLTDTNEVVEMCLSLVQNAKQEESFKIGYGAGAEKFRNIYLDSKTSTKTEKDPYDDDYDFYDYSDKDFPDPVPFDDDTVGATV
jgi:hypothetical protein